MISAYHFCQGQNWCAGLNGAGKSTLLKIMAGIETDYSGEAQAADGLNIGYLAQEPELDASLDVQGNTSCLVWARPKGGGPL